MKVRVISSLVGLVLLAVVFFFLDTILFNAVIAVICIIAVYELLKATGCARFPALYFPAMLTAAAIPFSRELNLSSFIPQVMFFLVLVFFVILIKSHRDLRVEQVAMVFFFSVFVPLFFSTAMFIRDKHGAGIGGLYLLWALGSAWLSDTGAYFTGRAFGKHKLAPVISPTKTIEGAVGGILTTCVFMLLLAWGYQSLMGRYASPINVDYLLMLAFTPFFAIAGILGDLSASLIKRQFGVKDYGNIMPGHGGILDRFDSVLFTIPAVFIVSQHIAVITAI